MGSEFSWMSDSEKEAFNIEVDNAATLKELIQVINGPTRILINRILDVPEEPRSIIRAKLDEVSTVAEAVKVFPDFMKYLNDGEIDVT
ncbi:hypothetical protein [Enterococcus sp. DIV1420a]|uniref:hypothetical protein n=1 Tax=Enterococcus sp. DIV1420a TaxID=2774672 RepID=UPI003F685405